MGTRWFESHLAVTNSPSTSADAFRNGASALVFDLNAGCIVARHWTRHPLCSC